MGTLRFARDLARFEEHLSWLAGHGADGRGDKYAGPGGAYADALAVSYGKLITELVAVEENLPDFDSSVAEPIAALIYKALDHAIDRHEQRIAVLRQADDRRDEMRAAEYAEAVRRHELAVTIECPYCGARPGQSCRTSGLTGKSAPKGVHDHTDRHRAATDPEWKAQAEQ